MSEIIEQLGVLEIGLIKLCHEKAANAHRYSLGLAEAWGKLIEAGKRFAERSSTGARAWDSVRRGQQG